MDLREMELFGTLMRVGTTMETARLLGISQPGVSAQLKRLESRLGVSLFHRTGNRLQPTSEAEDIYRMASPIFNTHAQIKARLPALRSQASRPAVVSATPALVEGFLGPVFARAGYLGWRKRLTLMVGSPEEDLRDRVADIGVQMALPPKAEFQAHAIGQNALVAVIDAGHELARRDRVDCEAISSHPLVCYDPDWSPMGARIREAFAARGLRYDPACTVPYCANVCAMVRACGGVGIVDHGTAEGQEGHGLVWRPIIDVPDVSIIAFYRRNEPTRGVVRDLLTTLVRHPAKPR